MDEDDERRARPLGGREVEPLARIGAVSGAASVCAARRRRRATSSSASNREQPHAASAPRLRRARRAWRTGSAGRPRRSARPATRGLRRDRLGLGAEQAHGEREMGEDMVDRAGLAPVAPRPARSSVGKRQHAAEQAPAPGGGRAAHGRHARASRRCPRRRGRAALGALTG